MSALPPGIYRRALVRAFAEEVGLESRIHAEGLPARVTGRPAGAGPGRPGGRAAGAWRLVASSPRDAGRGCAPRRRRGLFRQRRSPRRPASSPRPDAAPADYSRTARPEVVPAGGFADGPALEALPVTMLITVPRAATSGWLSMADCWRRGRSRRGSRCRWRSATRDWRTTSSNTGAVQCQHQRSGRTHAGRRGPAAVGADWPRRLPVLPVGALSGDRPQDAAAGFFPGEAKYP